MNLDKFFSRAGPDDPELEEEAAAAGALASDERPAADMLPARVGGWGEGRAERKKGAGQGGLSRARGKETVPVWCEFNLL